MICSPDSCGTVDHLLPSYVFIFNQLLIREVTLPLKYEYFIGYKGFFHCVLVIQAVLTHLPDFRIMHF